MDRVSIDLGDLCPLCLGSGKLKAMQRLALFGGGSVRGPDTRVTCTYCNGTGRRPTVRPGQRRQ